MRNRSMFIRKLTKAEIVDLQELQVGEYLHRPTPEGGFAETWYSAVMHFIAWCEDDVIPKTLIDREREIMEKGLSQMYFETLLDIIDPDPSLDTADKFVLLLGATSGERREALKIVLGYAYALE